MKRERFQSRLGFLLVSAGCAVGIGNVWKFPYVTGENGGGVFVLFYLLFLAIMGVPVLTMELAVGRASRKSAVQGYQALQKPGSKWHIHGWFCVAGCCLLMMYYTTVSGWMLGYFFKFAGGAFDGLGAEAVEGVFPAMLGNPIEIGIVVIWRVQNTAKAVFNVDNYMEFLSIQADSALRNIVRLYPYDIADTEEDECSLRGSSQKVAAELKAEIQDKVEVAGLEILEARITHLAYAPEIAAAMLQRQQASAIIDARKMIVDGAVGMVEMALEKLNENQIVQLDEERKAAMVSNLLVVLCGSKDAQPIVNSGSLY